MDFPKTYEVLDNMGKDFTELVLQQIEDKDGIASGELYNSINWKIEETEEGLTLYLLHAEHFDYWDKGTKPHFPPLPAIEDWVENKGLANNPKPMRIVRKWSWTLKSGEVKHNAKEVDILPTVKQIAFMVARKISIEGTEPRSAFEYAYNNLIGIYEPLIVEAFAEDMLENEGVVMALNNCLKNIM